MGKMAVDIIDIRPAERKPIPQHIRKIVYTKYGGRCAYCGQKLSLKTMSVDHIHPVVCGGTNDIKNLNPSCFECNNYKGGSGIEYLRKCILTMLNEKPHQRLFKSKSKMSLAVNLGAVELKKWDGIFYFERYVFDKLGLFENDTTDS